MLEQPKWEHRPDGSRVRLSNGIRIVDRSGTPQDREDIAHLVTHQDEGGQMIVIGLDEACRPVYTTTLYAYR